MNSVPGGADLERKNQYWIDLGVARERERILAIIKGSPTSFEFFEPFIGTETLIKKIEEGL